MLHFVVALQLLNTNHTLYNAVKKAEQDGHLLTEEARRAALHFRIDFEKGGIHLPSGIYPFHLQLCTSIKFPCLGSNMQTSASYCSKIRPS